MDISVIFEMFKGCDGYDALTLAGFLVAYVVAVKFDEIKLKKGIRL